MRCKTAGDWDCIHPAHSSLSAAWDQLLPPLTSGMCPAHGQRFRVSAPAPGRAAGFRPCSRDSLQQTAGSVVRVCARTLLHCNRVSLYEGRRQSATYSSWMLPSRASPPSLRLTTTALALRMVDCLPGSGFVVSAPAHYPARPSRSAKGQELCCSPRHGLRVTVLVSSRFSLAR